MKALVSFDQLLYMIPSPLHGLFQTRMFGREGSRTAPRLGAARRLAGQKGHAP